MRFVCYFCGKSVSSEVPEDTVLRAVCICPECIEEGRTVDDGKPSYVGQLLMGEEEEGPQEEGRE